ncbi:MAG: Fic family protein [Nanoarchaeota archaeon]
MVYLIKKKIKEKEYFYLISSVKIGDKVKKFQIYIGAKKPTHKKVLYYSNMLKNRIKEFTLKIDPLLTIIQKSDLKALEKSKKWYSKLSRQSPAIRENYYEWFITIYTYDSNAIEGSTLTLRDTSMVLFEGITPAGRSLRDILAAGNHKKAFDWILSYRGDINKGFILRLHKILTTGILSSSESGKIRKVQVYIRGSTQILPKPENVTPQLNALLKWYNANKRKYHPAVVASYFHTIFEGIHPFVDFNGRSGRLLLNFILLKNGYPPIDIRNKDRQQYYNAIKEAINGYIKPFVRLVVKYLKEINKT